MYHFNQFLRNPHFYMFILYYINVIKKLRMHLKKFQKIIVFSHWHKIEWNFNIPNTDIINK